MKDPPWAWYITDVWSSPGKVTWKWQGPRFKSWLCPLLTVATANHPLSISYFSWKVEVVHLYHFTEDWWDSKCVGPSRIYGMICNICKNSFPLPLCSLSVARKAAVWGSNNNLIPWSLTGRGHNVSHLEALGPGSPSLQTTNIISLECAKCFDRY